MSAVGVQAGDFKSGDIATALDPYLESIAEEMEKNTAAIRRRLCFFHFGEDQSEIPGYINNHGFKAAEVNGDSKGGPCRDLRGI